GSRFESISSRGESNFVRALFRSSDGLLWCGTNRGLFVQRVEGEDWLPVVEAGDRTVHAISEDPAHRILVGTASGLFIGRRIGKDPGPAAGAYRFARDADEGANVRALCLFKGGVFVAAFGRGLARLDGDTLNVVWPPDWEPGEYREVISLHSDQDRVL